MRKTNQISVSLTHPASKHGLPVILDRDGNPMDWVDGIRQALEQANVSYAAFAVCCKIDEPLLRRYGVSCQVQPAALNMLKLLLDSPESFGQHLDPECFALTPFEEEVVRLRALGQTFEEIGRTRLGMVRQKVHLISGRAAGKLEVANRWGKISEGKRKKKHGHKHAE